MIKWLKYLCGALGVVAFFSFLACSPTQASAASLKSLAPANSAGYASPLHSGSVVELSGSGGCHNGSMTVQPGPDNTSFTAKTGDQSITGTRDAATGTVTFPGLRDGTFVTILVPVNTDLNLKECNHMMVNGISGQMDLSAPGGMDVSNVRLFDTSHLEVKGGSLSFDGSLDQYSISTFDADNGVTIKLPKSDAFHIDATASDQSGNVNANPGSFCPTPRPNNVCHGSNHPGGLSGHLIAHAKWNIAINLV
jgi:hypothetical protein